jgi:hypothetical protein
MSEVGQKRKWPGLSAMSGQPPGADIARPPRDVRKVPEAGSWAAGAQNNSGPTESSTLIEPLNS